MKIPSKLCVPVTGENIEQFLENLQKIQKVHNFVELRFDFIKDFALENILQVKEVLKVSSIFVCRNKKDGGNFLCHDDMCKEILESGLKTGFDFVDIDFSCIKNLDLINKHPQTKIILSTHNFNETPGYRNLRKIQKQMRGYKPDIIKFATLIKTDKDIQNLLRLILSSKKEDKTIAIGMGQKGKITRILGPILGSPFGFATLQESITAPGQLSFAEMQEIWNYLKKIGINF